MHTRFKYILLSLILLFTLLFGACGKTNTTEHNSEDRSEIPSESTSENSSKGSEATSKMVSLLEIPVIKKELENNIILVDGAAPETDDDDTAQFLMGQSYRFSLPADYKYPDDCQEIRWSVGTALSWRINGDDDPVEYDKAQKDYLGEEMDADEDGSFSYIIPKTGDIFIRASFYDNEGNMLANSCIYGFSRLPFHPHIFFKEGKDVTITSQADEYNAAECDVPCGTKVAFGYEVDEDKMTQLGLTARIVYYKDGASQDAIEIDPANCEILADQKGSICIDLKIMSGDEEVDSCSAYINVK